MRRWAEIETWVADHPKRAALLLSIARDMLIYQGVEMIR